MQVLDIGGGMPVDYSGDDLSFILGPQPRQQQQQQGQGQEQTPHPQHPQQQVLEPQSVFARLAALLRARIPALWGAACGVQLVTECGRALVAKAVFAAARVQWAKAAGGRHIAVSPLGADLLLRAAYLPSTWPVRVQLCDAAGRPLCAPQAMQPPAAAAEEEPASSASACGQHAGDVPGVQGELARQQQQQDGSACGAQSARDGAARASACGRRWVATDVVGPLCFQGDKVAEARLLPAAAAGDLILVPDVGAYTLSMYCR